MEWQIGEQLLGVVAPVTLGAMFLAGSGEELWVGQVGAVAALAGIRLADDAFVRVGQSVPLS